ncbi:hypothetical protein, partial [Leclercia adecarboxylata]|uniref:hypothetical protein n=1 Tax=Leclercia adecarboxylata TaxID=83655 RepID=UPI003D2BC26D
ADHNTQTRLAQAFLWEGHHKITNEKDLLARTAVTFGTEPGSAANAFMNQVMLFKGVVSVISANKIRMMRRYEGAGMYGAIAADVVGATFAGMIGNSVVNATDGKKTDWTDITQWGKGFSTGGGAAFFGDLLAFGASSINPSGGATSTAGAIPGPTGSEIMDVFGVGRAVMRAANGKDTWGKAGFKALSFTRNHVPLLNLWYTKALTDHLFMNDLNEQLNPGYQDKLIKMNDEAGQGYFVPPTKNL